MAVPSGYMVIGYSGNGMIFKTEARCLRIVPKWKFLMVLIRAGLAIAWIRILFIVSLTGNEVGRDCVEFFTVVSRIIVCIL